MRVECQAGKERLAGQVHQDEEVSVVQREPLDREEPLEPAATLASPA